TTTVTSVVEEPVAVTTRSTTTKPVPVGGQSESLSQNTSVGENTNMAAVPFIGGGVVGVGITVASLWFLLLNSGLDIPLMASPTWLPWLRWVPWRS
ncbi:hypothetical protein JZY06_11825, partial [Corynebacterium sp. CCM 8862]